MIDDFRKIKSFFEEGQRVSLFRNYMNDEKQYETSVIACDNEKVFLSLIYDSDGDVLPIEDGGAVGLLLINKSGIWGAEVPVLGVFEGTENDGILVSLPEVLNKVQRREYVRLDFAFPLEFQILYRNTLFKKFKLKCYNMSANGIAVMTVSNIEISEKYEYKVVFEYKGIKVDNHVKPIYIHEVNLENSAPFYVMGCKFLDLSIANTDKIYAMINAELVKARKKGVM